MPHRQFIDSRRTKWEVWDVEPSHAERRRSEGDRRRKGRTSGERRQVDDHQTRVRIRPDLSHGWLAFESKHDRRRLAPIPTGWESLDETALERLCERAKSIGRPRRLLE